MRSIWAWTAVIIVGIVILALILGGGSSREAYRTARGVTALRVVPSQESIEREPGNRPHSGRGD